MEDKRNPIKRSEQLAPLSREHHEGLLFAWKIKQGIENKIPLERLRNYTLWYWRHHIKTHFFLEEEVLIPYMPANHPLAIRMHQEHDQIKELVLGLEDTADASSLAVLCELLNNHIRFEERELFGFMETLLTKQQLDTLFKQLEKHPLSKEKWTDEFWLKNK